MHRQVVAVVVQAQLEATDLQAAEEVAVQELHHHYLDLL
jgi:hypothetical protein